MAAVNNVWATKNLPPVVVLSGSDHHRRRQETRLAIRTLQERGFRFLRIQGEDHQALDGLVQSQGFLTAGNVLVVVDDPEKVDSATVLRHFNRGSGGTVLLLNQDGPLSRKKTDPLKEILAGIPAKFHAQFLPPKPWEASEVAVKFLEQHVKDQGLTLADRVAPTLVSFQGSDLGLLQFEMLKCILLARAQGETEITLAHVRATISPIAQAGVEPVVRALAAKNSKALLQALARLSSTYPDNSPPTMLVCAWVGNAAMSWLHAASLKALQVSDEDVAKMIGMHPFIYSREIAPILRKWPTPEIATLLRRITVVTRAVRMGLMDPWTLLETQFLGSAV